MIKVSSSPNFHFGSPYPVSVSQNCTFVGDVHTVSFNVFFTIKEGGKPQDANPLNFIAKSIFSPTLYVSLNSSTVNSLTGFSAHCNDTSFLMLVVFTHAGEPSSVLMTRCRPCL